MTNLLAHIRVIKLVSEPSVAFLALGVFPRTQVVNSKILLDKQFTLTYMTSDAWVGFIDVLQPRLVFSLSPQSTVILTAVYVTLFSNPR